MHVIFITYYNYFIIQIFWSITRITVTQLYTVLFWRNELSRTENIWRHLIKFLQFVQSSFIELDSRDPISLSPSCTIFVENTGNLKNFCYRDSSKFSWRLVSCRCAITNASDLPRSDQRFFFLINPCPPCDGRKPVACLLNYYYRIGRRLPSSKPRRCSGSSAHATSSPVTRVTERRNSFASSSRSYRARSEKATGAAKTLTRTLPTFSAKNFYFALSPSKFRLPMSQTLQKNRSRDGAPKSLQKPLALKFWKMSQNS